MDTKFYTTPFAMGGDRTTVPDQVQATGEVNYYAGYGYDYERDQSTDASGNPADPLAKDIERGKMNQILFDITANIHQYQVEGAPQFITADVNGGNAWLYAQGALVRFTPDNGVTWLLYRSLVSKNADAPPSPNWELIPVKATQDQVNTGTDDDTFVTPLKLMTLLQSMLANVRRYTPGQFVATFSKNPPPNTFVCPDADIGPAVSRVQYAALFGEIGITFGAGDGKTTFNLPTWKQGYALLGAGNGNVGDLTSGDVKSHAHLFITNAAGGHTPTGTTDAAGDHAHPIDTGRSLDESNWRNGASSVGGGQFGNNGDPGTYGATTKGGGSHTHPLKMDPVPDHAHSGTTDPAGGNANLAAGNKLLICIAY